MRSVSSVSIGRAPHFRHGALERGGDSPPCAAGDTDMSRSPRILLFAVAGLVGLLVLLVVLAAALLFFVDANVYKARLEAAASQALGMQMSIGGQVRIAFFPGLLITLNDVHIHNRGANVASAQEANLRIDLLPLLKKEVRIEKIVLKHGRISIERDRDGRLNLEKPDGTGSALPALDWPRISLVDATLVYADKRFGEGFEAGDCDLDMHRLRLAGGERSNLMRDVSFTAEFTCGEVRGAGFTVSDLKFSADAKNGVFDLEPVTMVVFGAQGAGSIGADFSGAVPRYHVRYSLLQFPVDEFFKAMALKEIAAGRMDFSANLSMQGKTAQEMRQSLQGQISLRGKNLALSGMDLDREFARFESTQNFNLVDVGAFFFAGPLGLVVTKGYSFATLLQATGGSSEIRTLVSDWKVEHGVAQAQDVAMATRENRVALQGGLDFVNAQFNDVSLALIDAKGCAKVRQKIRGTFLKPVVEKPSALESVVGPALRLLKKGAALLGAECDVFYAGSVAAPE